MDDRLTEAAIDLVSIRWIRIALLVDAPQADKVAAFAARHFAHLDGGSMDRVIDKVNLAP
jgi:hypothetical protein